MKSKNVCLSLIKLKVESVYNIFQNKLCTYLPKLGVIKDGSSSVYSSSLELSPTMEIEGAT